MLKSLGRVLTLALSGAGFLTRLTILAVSLGSGETVGKLGGMAEWAVPVSGSLYPPLKQLMRRMSWVGVVLDGPAALCIPLKAVIPPFSLPARGGRWSSERSRAA